jgi:2,3-bisphosphoglycerate-independent phosphoglycerate mutase
MISVDKIKELANSTESKIVVLVLDGLGGLPDPVTGKTELETANRLNLDALAQKSICGLADPVSPGITPGSGPGHLGLFGYDPLRYEIGRGILEALGIDFDITKDDLAARGNFCTVDEKGLITDRRAGRISTDRCKELCALLNKMTVPGVQLFFSPVREHRFLLVIRHKSLEENVCETDPQKLGVAPLKCVAEDKKSEFTARVVNQVVQNAARILADKSPANMILLRGFSKMPDIPSIKDIYKLNAAALATYPMYRGLAKLVGMNVLQPPEDIVKAVGMLGQNWKAYDYFFVHFKYTDSSGEDGDFNRKVKSIETADAVIPSILNLKPDVLIVTADHSTPALMKSHSWHPVPFLLYSKYCRPDAVREFTESACLGGGLGRFPSVEIMTLAMANALKLTKYGA